jgi:DNA-directed RNA polymerase
MVVPYAGKFSSCLAYTKEAVAEKLLEGHPCLWDTSNDQDHNERQVYLAKLIWEAIDEVVVKGKEAMQWLSRIASDYSKWANKIDVQHPYNRRMSWLTPDGFEVVHYREDTTRTQMQTRFDGRVDLVLYQDNGKLNAKDMALAVAPNFVHALDATHLRATIIRAKDMGINQFGMVHDSFGVHAKHMPNFIRDCVKPAFVEMYSEHDVLKEFHDRFAQVIPVKPMPEKGRLDLNGILNSEFFFS